jgi:hypothetical protein
MGYHNVISTNLAFVIPLIWFGLFLLLFRLICKLKWLTAVCLAVIAGTAPSLLGLYLFAPAAPKPGWVVLLPSAVCAVILIIHWVARGEDSSVKTAERAKILRMVEEGKISAEEGSDLLDAMGRSTALRGQEKFSRLDFVTLIGAALVILGFFLPWINIRSVTQMFGRISAYQAGYQVGAVGWAIFIIGILSTVPVFVTPKDFLYKISMLQIFLTLIGLVLVISVLVRAGHNLGAGLILCLAGFIVELFASAVKFKRLAA